MKVLKKITSKKTSNVCYRISIDNMKALIQVENNIAEEFNIDSDLALKTINKKIESNDFTLSSKKEKIISISKSDIS